MIKKLLILLFVSNFSALYAQTIKTGVLIIGGSASGVAAAVQCARSKVKTVFIAEDIELDSSLPTSETLSIPMANDVPSGIWGEFCDRVRDFCRKANGNDTLHHSSLQFTRTTAETILKKMTDSVKNLSIYLNASFTAIKKEGDRWAVKILKKGKKVEIKPRVIVDATENGVVAEKAGAKFKDEIMPAKFNSESKLYRIAVAAGEIWSGLNKNPPYNYWFVPMKAVLPEGLDNLLITGKILPPAKSLAWLPLQLELGQGAGAVAAYCAFYKTTTKSLNVRAIQGELLDFKGYLVPFADIGQNDPDWRAIQQVCATGLLKGEKRTDGNEVQFDFMPDSLAKTAEIEPVLTEIYTRAFLWFRREKPGEKFTLGNMLSFISDYSLTDPVILQHVIQKDWKTKFKFKSDFDLNRQITRREFAVLASKYLNPFGRTVDLDGKFLN